MRKLFKFVLFVTGIGFVKHFLEEAALQFVAKEWKRVGFKEEIRNILVKDLSDRYDLNAMYEGSALRNEVEKLTASKVSDKVAAEYIKQNLPAILKNIDVHAISNGIVLKSVGQLLNASNEHNVTGYR